MNWRRTLTIPLALAALLPALVGTATPAAAASTTRVRLAQLTDDSPTNCGAQQARCIDFYIDGVRAWSGITFSTVSTYVTVAAGSHDFAVRAAGAAAGSSPEVQVNQSLDSGTYYTVVTAGKWDALKAAVFSDGFPSLASGKAAARFIHTAPEVPGVNVAVQNGPTVFSNISFMQATPYAVVDAGTYTFQLQDPVTKDPLFTAQPVTPRAGVVYSLIGTGGVNTPVSLVVALDASSASATPSGGAGTGAGGTAYAGGLRLAPIAAMLLLTAALIVLAALPGVRPLPRNR